MSEVGATPEPPFLLLVRGSPEPDELAAIVAVLAARASDGVVPPKPKRSMWAARSRQVRTTLGAGAGAWRASTLPR